MAIGTLGPVLFEQNGYRTMTPRSLNREVTSRAVSHEAIGGKPRTEFLGPGLQTISLEILLRADRGVRPRAMLDQLAQMVETGEVHRLVLGGKPIGQNRVRVTGTSEAWNTVYCGGELFSATVTINLEEYV